MCVAGTTQLIIKRDYSASTTCTVGGTRKQSVCVAGIMPKATFTWDQTRTDWILFTQNRLEPVQVLTWDLYKKKKKKSITGPKLALQNDRSRFGSVPDWFQNSPM